MEKYESIGKGNVYESTTTSSGEKSDRNFFKPKTLLKIKSLSKNQTEKDDLVIIEPSDIPSSSTPRLSQTSNANEAIYNRETFLNEKEMEQLKTFFTQMEIPFTNFFTEDVKNDQKLLDCFKTFVYEWDKFSELKTQYEGGKTRDRETQLSSKLVEIDASIEQIKLLLEEICLMSSKKTLSTYEMSQSYLKKANLITEAIVALGALKKMITNRDFLTSLRRRLKQQNDVTNKSFVRSENELLNFFCENDTKLKWGVVQDNLIDFENSRFNLGTIEIDELLTTAGILSENVVTFMSELPFNVTPEKVRKIVKLMPVIYLKNNQNSAFVNLHEFVFTPGIFESIFLINDDDGDETAVEEEQNEGSEANEATSGRSGIGGLLQ